MIKLVVPGEPKALQRHRTTMQNGKQRQYDPQSKEKIITRNFLLSEKQKKEWPSIDKIGFDITVNFYFYRKPSQRTCTEETLNNIPHTQKPDIDNLIKYILDCGNGILWHDDAEIYKITAQKFWSKTPRTEIIHNG